MKINVPYKLKMLGLGALATAGTVFSSCEREEEPIQQHDTYYYFAPAEYEALKNFAQIKASADSAQVRKIYFIPCGTWEYVSADGAHNLRKNVLEPALAIAPTKTSGDGEFEGMAGIHQADSLWYSQNGWKINQH
jgi:hypothetical protein